MKQRGIESLLVTHLPDVRYLCGFTGSNAFLAITANRASMFTDGRYTAQARQETTGARVVVAAKSARDEACRWLAASGVKHCAFDPETTTVAGLALYRKALAPGHRARAALPSLSPPFASPCIDSKRYRITIRCPDRRTRYAQK